MGDRDNISSRQITRKALPLEKANVHNGSKAGNTDFLTSNLTPSTYIRGSTTYRIPTLFRVQIMLPSAGKFTAKITDGTNELTCHYNGGSNLTANALYIFDTLMHDGDQINFQSDQAQAGFLLRVQEIAWGVQ